MLKERVATGGSSPGNRNRWERKENDVLAVKNLIKQTEKEGGRGNERNPRNSILDTRSG